MHTERAAWLIRDLGLSPHREGGHFREVVRSARSVFSDPGGAPRAALTAIYFLLAAGEVNRWHRVAHDELWHWIEGSPLELTWLAANDMAERRTLGPLVGDQVPLVCVPAGAWQSARQLGAYALLSCTVAPGFSFADFTLLANDPAARARVLRRFPELADRI